MTIALTRSTSTLPAMASGETVLEGAREIPLPLIVPSKTNRRTVRNPEKDAELTESIRMRGVQQPIVVRIVEASTVKAGEIIPKYEIVCGHRRYEMSLKAGKATIPAVVKKLSNADALDQAELASFIAMICCVYEVVPGVQDFCGRDKKNLGGFDKRHKIGLEKVRDRVTKEMRSKFAEIDARKKAKASPQTSAKKKKGKAA